MGDETEYKIDVKTAISLLIDKKNIHTFTQGPLLIGCDSSRERIIEMLNEFKDNIEITGSLSRSMEHGIVVKRGNLGFLFLETKKDIDWSVYD